MSAASDKYRPEDAGRQSDDEGLEEERRQEFVDEVPFFRGPTTSGPRKLRQPKCSEEEEEEEEAPRER